MDFSLSTDSSIIFHELGRFSVISEVETDSPSRYDWESQGKNRKKIKIIGPPKEGVRF